VIGALALVIGALALGGCAGTSVLLHPPPPPKTHAGAVYLAQLAAEQGQAVVAERAVPMRPHTPAQLARSIVLLAAAVRQEASGLEAIRPPQSVARLHRRLVAITTQYASRLLALARRARLPQLEVAAANDIARATDATSVGFTTTVHRIRIRLARR
jgi:hypothetical protein